MASSATNLWHDFWHLPSSQGDMGPLLNKMKINYTGAPQFHGSVMKEGCNDLHWSRKQWDVLRENLLTANLHLSISQSEVSGWQVNSCDKSVTFDHWRQSLVKKKTKQKQLYIYHKKRNRETSRIAVCFISIHFRFEKYIKITFPWNSFIK